jgi:hypothetical protein
VKKVSFVVEGLSIFPIDMLRSDRCYPEDSTSVGNIIWTYDQLALADQMWLKRPFRVGLISDKEPSDRWATFGWTVVSKRKLR